MDEPYEFQVEELFVHVEEEGWHTRSNIKYHETPGVVQYDQLNFIDPLDILLVRLQRCYNNINRQTNVENEL